MLLPKLLIDLSDLRDQRDAGEITSEEYSRLETEARKEFRRKEAEAFEAQINDITAQIKEMEIDLARERHCIMF